MKIEYKEVSDISKIKTVELFHPVDVRINGIGIKVTEDGLELNTRNGAITIKPISSNCIEVVERGSFT